MGHGILGAMEILPPKAKEKALRGIARRAMKTGKNLFGRLFLLLFHLFFHINIVSIYSLGNFL